MNQPFDPAFDQRLADWLEDDPSTAPREVLGTVLAAFPSIDQRRASRVPWRFPLMNRYLLPIAAALIVVIGAAYILFRPASDVGPRASLVPPSPTATPPSIVGTWDVTFTSQEMLDAGVIPHVATDPDDYGHFRLTFTADQWQLSHLSPVAYVNAPAAYTTDPGIIHIGQPSDTGYNMPYTVTETTLTLGQPSAIWAIKPWTRVATEALAAPVAGPTELRTQDVDRSLVAGTYRPRGFAVELAVTLPPGGWKMTGLAHGGVGFENPAVQNSNFALFVLNGVYADPCHPAAKPDTIGPGADGVVAALSSVQGFAVTDVRDVTVGGLHGRRFLFGNDIDTAAAGCAANPMPFGTSDQDGEGKIVDMQMFGGETDRFWALEAGDVTIVAAITDEPEIFADAQPVFETIVFGDGAGG